MKILLIAPYGLGNTILTLPAMQALRYKYPYDKIDLLTPLNSVYNLVDQIPDFHLFNRVYKLKIKSLLKIIWQRYDYSILAFPTARIHYNILNFLCFAKNRVGSYYPDINFSRGAFLNTINIPVKIGLHDVYQNLRMLKIFGIREIKINKLISRLATVKNKKIIGIHAGCKQKHYYKKWGNENFLAIIKLLLEKTHYTIKLFFGPDEEQDHGFFFKELKNNPRIKYIISPSLKNLFKEINECRFFFSNDAGLMHIANFLNAYNIVIAGPSDFRRTGPFNKPQKIITNNPPCSPCSHTYHVSSHHFKCIPGDLRCIRLISVDMVWKELKKIL